MPDDFTLGEHAARIANIETDLRDVKADAKWIREYLAERKGERRVALWAASVGGGLLATITGIVAKKLGLTP